MLSNDSTDELNAKFRSYAESDGAVPSAKFDAMTSIATVPPTFTVEACGTIDNVNASAAGAKPTLSSNAAERIGIDLRMGHILFYLLNRAAGTSARQAGETCIGDID